MTFETGLRGSVVFLLLATIAFLCEPPVGGQVVPLTLKRPVTVADSVEMRMLGDQDYFAGGSSEDRVAHFSPDGSRFVILLRKGNLQRNTNDYSLMLFDTAEVFHSPKPELLVTMSSSSNRPAIRDIKWLSDNNSIAFLGENIGESSQVHVLNAKTRQIQKVTNHSSPIVTYAITSDGGELLFVAERRTRDHLNTEETSRNGLVITGQSLADILGGVCAKPTWDTKELFLQVKGQSPVLIPVEDAIWSATPVILSPDGRYALLQAWVRKVPAEWSDYRDEEVRRLVSQVRGGGKPSRLRRYLLLDVNDRSVAPLLNSPIKSFDLPEWGARGESVFLKGTFLPLDPADSHERQVREVSAYDVEVKLPNRNIRRVPQGEWPKSEPKKTTPEMVLEEDLNRPPRIYSFDPTTGKKELLMDLNPQFDELELSRAEVIHWRANDGREVQGGLYLPRKQIPGKRYPLVIQTHGFLPNRFSLDGRLEWGSAFAAQQLASRGFVVLQSAMFSDSTEQEGPREMASYEGAIDYLDGRGLIDRNRVGIVGFSRTVYEVGYALTHSKYHFAAASLVDGIDGSYFQYIAFGPGDDVLVNGGQPIGKGLELWLKNSPGFNLERVHTPLRLLALGRESVLEEWEWYSVLKQLQRPVDLILLPDAEHLVVKPWERLTAQEGLVDWFRFWLLNEEDDDSNKDKQYQRWGELRRQYNSVN